MRILQLCNKVPFPVVDGGTAAMHQISDQLHKAGHHVKVIAAKTFKHDVNEQQLPEDYKKVFSPEYVFFDIRIKSLPAFINLFSSASYNIERFDVPAMHQLIEQTLKAENFDCVILDSLYMTPYISTIRKFSKAKIILRSHNVEHMIWERQSMNEKNAVKRKYLSMLAKKLKKYEMKAIQEVDGIAAIGVFDVNFFSRNCKTKTAFIPFGYETKADVDFEQFKNDKAYFLGVMNWDPNLESAEWMLQHLIPVIKSDIQAFHLTLAGPYMPPHFFEAASTNFHVKDRIENVPEFLKDFGILLAPIFSGGGIKVKVIEAMARGKLVITTPIGVEGMNAENGKHLIVCNTGDEFLKEIKKCQADRRYAAAIARNGFELMRRDFQPSAIINNLEQLIQSC